MTRVAARRGSFVVTVLDDAGEEWTGELILRPPLVEGVLSVATGTPYHEFEGVVLRRGAGGLADDVAAAARGFPVVGSVIDALVGAPAPAVWATVRFGFGERPLNIDFTAGDWLEPSGVVVDIEPAPAGWLRTYLEEARGAVDGVFTTQAGSELPVRVWLGAARLFLALNDVSAAERAIRRALPGLRRHGPTVEDVDAGKVVVHVLVRWFDRNSTAAELRHALRL